MYFKTKCNVSDKVLTVWTTACCAVSIVRWRPRNLAELVPTLDRNGADLISKMLVYLPQHRITARAALQHPYFEVRLEHHMATCMRPCYVSKGGRPHPWLVAG